MVIIIPAKNEASTLPQVLAAVRRVTATDVLLIDDGSTDRTCAAACGLEGVHVVRHARSLGYGRALLEGFTWAAEHGHETAVTMDADLQHEASDLPAFFAAIENCDIASGTRYHALSTVEGVAPQERMALNMEITEILRRITGWPLTDSFCGYKSWRVNQVRSLGCVEMGYAMPLELWIRAWAAGLRMVEVPTARIYRPVERSFDGPLDDAEVRRCYYMEVIRRTLAAVGHAHDGERAALPRC